ncbi:hypothetical protein BJ742DRAFT_818630 [Cladochytrium replicatum]|nr:hypothetical protein BJ742DRAFT_818630 [Cladochytrium replicatum]
MTNDLLLYHYKNSTADISLSVLKVLGIPFDLISVDSKAGDLKTPSYLALNPNGLVPLLVHNGTPIFESAAITIYLGETFGEKLGLFPSRGPLRGEALKWIVWGVLNMATKIWTQVMSPSDENAAGLNGSLKILEDELGSKNFLLGSDYSLVDTHIAAILNWVQYSNVDLSSYKKLANYHKACLEKIPEDTNMGSEKKNKGTFIDAFDTVVFDAPPSKVYSLFTLSKEFSAWSGVPVTIPHEHGVEFTTHGGRCVFKFVTCITDKMIVAHYREADWEWDGFATVVFALSEIDGKTRMNFSIYGVPGGDYEKKRQVQVWQEYSFAPMAAYLKKNAPAPFCWVDIQVKDANRAETFYKNIFNWSFMPGMKENERFFTAGSAPSSFGGYLTEDPVGLKPYVAVQDLEGTLELVKSKGGEVVSEIQPAGDDGRICAIKDPEGNVIGLHSRKKPAPDLALYWFQYSTADISLEVLKVLGVPFDLKTVDFKGGETKTPAYRALNPNGLVPLLVHKGTRIFESAAITIYLGEMFGVEKGLFPSLGPKRAEAMKWIVWGNVTLAAGVGKAEKSKSKEDIVSAVKAMDILDAALEGKKFLLGDYSLVDTHVASIVFWVQMTKVVDFAKMKKIPTWMEQCQKNVPE